MILRKMLSAATVPAFRKGCPQKMILAKKKKYAAYVSKDIHLSIHFECSLFLIPSQRASVLLRTDLVVDDGGLGRHH